MIQTLHPSWRKRWPKHWRCFLKMKRSGSGPKQRIPWMANPTRWCRILLCQTCINLSSGCSKFIEIKDDIWICKVGHKEWAAVKTPAVDFTDCWGIVGRSWGRHMPFPEFVDGHPHFLPRQTRNNVPFTSITKWMSWCHWNSTKNFASSTPKFQWPIAHIIGGKRPCGHGGLNRETGPTQLALYVALMPQLFRHWPQRAWNRGRIRPFELTPWRARWMVVVHSIPQIPLGLRLNPSATRAVEIVGWLTLRLRGGFNT